MRWESRGKEGAAEVNSVDFPPATSHLINCLSRLRQTLSCSTFDDTSHLATAALHFVNSLCNFFRVQFNQQSHPLSPKA